MASCAAAGNPAQTGLADMAMAMMEDPRVTAIGLHIEGIGDVRAFEALAAKARQMGKPVVVLKVGRSEQARAGAFGPRCRSQIPACLVLHRWKLTPHLCRPDHRVDAASAG